MEREEYARRIMALPLDQLHTLAEEDPAAAWSWAEEEQALADAWAAEHGPVPEGKEELLRRILAHIRREKGELGK